MYMHIYIYIRVRGAHLVSKGVVEGDGVDHVLVPLQSQQLFSRQRVPHLCGCARAQLSLYTILLCTILYVVYGIKTGGRREVEYCAIVLQ